MIPIHTLLESCERPVKLLYGVNSGPMSFGTLIDETQAFRDARFPLIRFHDTNWPNPREVDYYTIFPDFDADADDPSNYDFRATDEYIRQSVATGAELMFRLGVSIEHAEKKYHVAPPKDVGQLAKIFRGIVRHYREGWGGGEPCSRIRYWEIWNEPDLRSGFGFTDRPSPTWMGDAEEFCRLYEAAALCLKEYDQTLCVGGPGFANLDSPFTAEVLHYIVSKHLPLDFCSWHCYSSELDRPVRQARWLRELLDHGGYTDTLSILDEWDYMVPGFGSGVLFGKIDPRIRRDIFMKTMSETGAAFAAAMLITMQAEPVDDAAFFSADPCNLFSMFDHYGVPQKNYYAFRQFSDAAQRGRITALHIPEGYRGVFLMRTEDEDGQSILISNLSERPERLELPAEDGVRYTLRRTDRYHDYRLEHCPEGQTLSLMLPGYCVLTLERAEKH